MNGGVLNDGIVNGSKNWLPSQNPSTPPGVVVTLDVNLDARFMGSTGTSPDAILANLREAIVALVNSSPGPTLAVGAVTTVAVGVDGVTIAQNVVFDNDPSLATIPTPTSTAPQYVQPRVRTIA